MQAWLDLLVLRHLGQCPLRGYFGVTGGNREAARRVAERVFSQGRYGYRAMAQAWT